MEQPKIMMEDDFYDQLENIVESVDQAHKHGIKLVIGDISAKDENPNLGPLSEPKAFRKNQ